MKTKKLIVLLMAAVFTLGVAGLCFSAQEVKGTISKIEGSTLTILDNTGKEVTVQVKEPVAAKALKVGDKVSVKDGKVIKESN